MSSVLWLLYAFAYHSGIIDLFYRWNRRRNVVIAYHHILPDRLIDNSTLLAQCHGENAFANQLKIINKRWPHTGKCGRGECKITFDDGYANNYAIAAPLLEKFGRRGLFFVVLDLVRNGKALWPDQMFAWLSHVPSGRYELCGRTFEIHSPASRRAVWSEIWDEIRKNYRSKETIRAEMERNFLFERLSFAPELKELRLCGMTEEQIADLKRRGHLIGAHSARHDILACLLDEELERDFRECEDSIGTVFNCADYAYPFGGLDEVAEREWATCRRSKFRSGYMATDFKITAPVEDEFNLAPRISLPNTSDRYVIEARLSGFEAAIKRLVRVGRSAPLPNRNASLRRPMRSAQASVQRPT